MNVYPNKNYSANYIKKIYFFPLKNYFDVKNKNIMHSWYILIM